jgi:hypothetical protein
MLISTELVLIDEQTPTHSFLGRDLNENFQMNTNDGNLFQQRYAFLYKLNNKNLYKKEKTRWEF